MCMSSKVILGRTDVLTTINGRFLFILQMQAEAPIIQRQECQSQDNAFLDKGCPSCPLELKPNVTEQYMSPLENEPRSFLKGKKSRCQYFSLGSLVFNMSDEFSGYRGGWIPELLAEQGKQFRHRAETGTFYSSTHWAQFEKNVYEGKQRS